MAARTRIVMRITYNVSTTGAVMAVRCTRRRVRYGRVIAAIMVLEVAGVIGRAVVAVVTVRTTARCIDRMTTCITV